MSIRIEKGSSVGCQWILNDDTIIGTIRSIDYEGHIQNNKQGYELRIYTKPFDEVDVFVDSFKDVTKVLHAGSLQSCKKYALNNL